MCAIGEEAQGNGAREPRSWGPIKALEAKGEPAKEKRYIVAKEQEYNE